MHAFVQNEKSLVRVARLFEGCWEASLKILVEFGDGFHAFEELG